MISVCITFKNDFEDIERTVKTLIETAKGDDYEIVVYNDGSNYGTGKPRDLVMDYPHLRVINFGRTYGVGYGFDRAVEHAKGEILVIMGADIFVREGWDEKVANAVQSNPNTLGCAVCIGLNPEKMDMNDPKCFKRYGADLLFFVGADDLPLTSPLRARRGGYTELFKAKWLMGKKQDEPYEIPCLLGAFYFTSKDYYKRLGGWDTVPGNMYCGHRFWGHLEPYISLKSWLMGGGCTLYPDIEVGHVFARLVEKSIVGRRRPRVRITQLDKGSRGEDWMHWNSLFMLETMIFDEELRQKLYKFMLPELNWSVAKQMIKRNYQGARRVREENRLKLKYDHRIFTERFDYDFDIK